MNLRVLNLRAVSLCAVVWTLVGWTALACLPRQAKANGQIDQRTAGGLHMQCDSRWSPSGGYRPFRFTFTPARPLTTERSLRILIRTSTWGYVQRVSEVDEYLELPVGPGPTQFTLLAPQYGHWNNYDIEVHEDGDEIPGLRLGVGLNSRNDNTLVSEVLVVGDLLPDPAQTFSATPAQMDGVVHEWLNTTNSSLRAHQVELPLDMLPVRWLEYTSLDLVVIRQSRLEQLAKQHPQQLIALRQWLSAGGNVWVVDCGKNWERLESVEKVWNPAGSPGLEPLAPVRFTPRPNESRADVDAAAGDSDSNELPKPIPIAPKSPAEAAARSRGWLAPYLDLRDPNASTITPNYFPATKSVAPPIEPGPGGAGSLDQEILTQINEIQRLERDGLSIKEACDRLNVPVRTYHRWVRQVNASAQTQLDGLGVLYREVGLGLLAVFQADQPHNAVSLPTSQALAMSNLGSPWRLTWERRHGVNPSGWANDFGDFLVPGVGMAPVGAFQILITVFAVAIGPLNYWLLRRQGRLHLLIVTVPLLAGFVTFSLFAYALISDGLGVRVRARSVTHLDQKAGQASCAARLSFYAGLAPYGGMVFPPDTAVYPIHGSTGDDGLIRYRSLHWEGEQYMGSGWLSSRTPLQLATFRARPSEAKLVVTPGVEGQPPTVENRLGATIQKLVLCDLSGALFTLDELAPGASAKPMPIDDPSTFSGELRADYQTFAPTTAPGYVAGGPGFGRRYYYWNYDYMSSVSNQDGLMEQALRGPTYEGRRPRPGSYAALVDQSPEVVHGVSSGVEESSYHLILGSW